MLASELRGIANLTNKNNLDKESLSAASYFETLCVKQAEKGKYQLRIELGSLHFSREIIELSFKHLQSKGFTCKIENEITAQYTNTDWDSDDFLYIKW